VSQISPPVRIILIGAVVFLAAWFTVLRPKAETIAPTTTTPTSTQPTTGLGRAVAKAKAVAGKSDAAGKTDTPAATTAAAAAPQTKPLQAPVAIPAAALAKLPKDVAAALAAHNVLVLGVIADQATAYRQAGPALQALRLRLAGQRPRCQPDPERRGDRP
jgi:hypothetical protein